MAPDTKRAKQRAERPPVPVHVDAALVEAVRAEYPQMRDWPPGRVAAACLAMALKWKRP